MRTGLYILVIAFMACCVAACGGHADRASLVAIDSLILQDPDSACGMLAAYPADSLTTDDDRAYHALLTTIADYKAYRPATTDSAINIAVNHYDHSGANPDHRMRSLLYKGCVMEELSNDKEAMRYYKHAQEACPDNDEFNKGYIYFRIGSLYKRNAEVQQAIINYNKASNCFSHNQSDKYYRTSIRNLGALYRSSNQDSALYYINKGIKLSRLAKDKEEELSGIINLSGYYFNKEDYVHSKNIALKVIDCGDEDLISDLYVYYFACLSYAKLNNIDSAQVVLDKMPYLQSAVDSMQFYRCKAEILRAKGDMGPEYQKSIDIAESIDDLLIQEPYNNGLVAIEKEIEKEHATLLTRYKTMCVAACVLVVALIAVFYYRSQKKYRRINDKLKEEVTRLNGEITQSLAEVELIKENGVEDKKKLNEIIESIDASLACYSSLLTNLLKQMKATSKEKNTKLAAIMDEDFFAQLRLYVNLRYDNLIDKLANGDYNLNKEEINIICLELCRFPNLIQWVHSNCDRYKSLLNKKKIIANKVNGSESIADIPQNI